MSRSFSKVLPAVATTLIAVLGFTSMAAAVPNRAPVPPPTTYWQNKGFMLMAHQGGEWDYPPNTMFAYKSAVADGADVIDMDAYVTQDGKLVLTHDPDANDNSDAADVFGSGAHPINTLTVAQLQTLDFAAKWSPHDGSSVTPYKGIANSTGTDNPPPPGFTRHDFTIPTFSEVLAAFPNTPINIELKQVPGVSIDDTVTAMANELASHPGHDSNVLINSFGQEMLDAMHAKRPEHLAYSGSQNGLLAYLSGTPISPVPVALEPPDQYKLSGNWVRTVPILKPSADYDGYKMFVWGSDHDPAQDTPPFYDTLINTEKVDSYNTPDPIALANWLCTNGTPKPDGSPRCSSQVCPAGKTGIAPNNCVDIPVCPEGKTGTPPDCVTPPALRIKSVRGPKKVRAGKKFSIDVTLSNPGGQTLQNVSVCLTVPKSSRSKVKTGSCAKIKFLSKGGVIHRDLAARVLPGAKGEASIKVKATASNGNAASGGWTGKVIAKSCKSKGSNGQLCGETNHL